jgi:soluble lytic murein transglycosylase
MLARLSPPDRASEPAGEADLEPFPRPRAAAAPRGAAAPLRLAPGDPPPNADVIRALLAHGLYDDAIGELRAVQRRHGNSPLVDATLAFALHQRGELRPAITSMRRAYPQFMAEGGEALPVEILRVIFPLEHWDLIRRHAGSRRLDPFLMAALIAQESTFDAAIRSSANAWGLMQVIPSTGRRYAQLLGIRPFSTSRLTHPETNVRIGMAYFADLVSRFGDAAPALAAYNAGEQRVARWLAERPGVERDEFIDDIPFPETQNYVKRILGTAEDYRILYR